MWNVPFVEAQEYIRIAELPALLVEEKAVKVREVIKGRVQVAKVQDIKLMEIFLAVFVKEREW